MIASYTNDFIFIKTRKTASTSAEIVLSSWCSADDICTPITLEDEIIRHSYGGRAMNCSFDSSEERAYQQAIEMMNPEKMVAAAQRLQKTLQFWNHMSGVEVQQRLPGFWNRAFKFCVERHPYEKVVSLAYFLAKEEDHKDFSRKLDETIEAGLYRNYDLYTRDGRVIVDRLVQYSELDSFMRELAARVQRVPVSLPRAKSRFRRDKRGAAEILSSSQKSSIQRICWEEFCIMGFLP